MGHMDCPFFIIQINLSDRCRVNNSDTGNTKIKELLSWLLTILAAAAIAIAFRAFVAENVIVVGSSMEDTLSTGQRLIIYKLGYMTHTPLRGDIIVLDSSSIMNTSDAEVDYVKRIIALPGEEINIRGGNVYINGEILDEPYVMGTTYPNGTVFPMTIPEGTYFVMGDNRQVSYDSRQIGVVEIRKIKGEAIFRIWPINEIGKIN